LLAAATGAAGCAVKVIQIGDGASGSGGSGGRGRGSGGSGGAGASNGDESDAGAAERPSRFPAPFCIDYHNDQDETCRSCYDQAGGEINTRCVLPPRCTAREGARPGDPPCLICLGADGTTTMTACLSCEPAQDICQVCTWSDTAALCRACTDASGAPSYASCLALRPERL